MKKSYVKPELFYESFVLSQSIAACGIDVHYKNENECQPTLDEKFWHISSTVFEDSAKCSTIASGIEGYCYTSGTTEAGRLFNS